MTNDTVPAQGGAPSTESLLPPEERFWQRLILTCLSLSSSVNGAHWLVPIGIHLAPPMLRKGSVFAPATD
jgi:hypothetical protein